MAALVPGYGTLVAISVDDVVDELGDAVRVRLRLDHLQHLLVLVGSLNIRLPAPSSNGKTNRW